MTDGTHRFSAVTSTLMVLALLFSAYVLRDLLTPVVIAILFGFLFAPGVRWLFRHGIPRAVGAALILVVLAGGVGAGMYFLWTPALEWLSRTPTLVEEVSSRLQELKEPVEAATRQATEVGEQVEELTNPSDGEVPQVEIRTPTLVESMFEGGRVVIGQVVVGLILLYLLLASGDALFYELLRLHPSCRVEGDAVALLGELEASFSRYLQHIALINLGLGVVVGVTMHLLGMPTPALWGAMAGLLNFVPYLGALVTGSVIGIVALLTFDSVSRVILTLGVYISLTSLEGMIITPTILGKRNSLNPVVVFLGLMFWGWIWGIPGMLIAVPLLVIIRILLIRSQRFEVLARIMSA